MGGTAAAWLVMDERSAQSWALKVFSAGEASQSELGELRREAAILGRLSHPHLLSIREVIPTDQGPALLMSYAGGGSLLSLLAARGRLGVGEAVTVLAPIAQALTYLHAEAVLHGDVSPGNVLFSAEGKPLLADLGVGRLLGEGSGGMNGTPGFCDPAVRVDARLNTAADVYSLASLGWYCLTGQPAGPALQRPPLTLIVPDVPAELLEVLEAGLHEDPERRPTAREFSLAVLRSAAPQPLDLVGSVHPSVLPQLLTRRAARNEPKTPKRKFPVRVKAKDKVAPRKAGARRRQVPTDRPEPRTERGRRAIAVVIGVVAAALVICGALVAGPDLVEAAHRNGGSERTPVGAAQGSDTSESLLSPELRARLAADDPVEVLAALAAVRARALATADPELLAHVNVADSETMAADKEVVAGLQAADQVFQGLSVRLKEVRNAQLENVDKDSAAVAATAVTSAYTIVNADGTTVRTVPEATSQNLIFMLKREEGLWRIAAVHEPDAA
ncbi:hypothetical protein BJ994_001189 [Arthrobacter pigmenti]|uniref:Protein kinase domain-containing protein n=2 Tax=Arthrobacter pigmenti TaxID=271432 RepID=A0A846RG72_9MICC|nr:hypothetical protein [Arthrobacter pigmenti]